MLSVTHAKGRASRARAASVFNIKQVGRRFLLTRAHGPRGRGPTGPALRPRGRGVAVARARNKLWMKTGLSLASIRPTSRFDLTLRSPPEIEIESPRHPGHTCFSSGPGAVLRRWRVRGNQPEWGGGATPKDKAVEITALLLRFGQSVPQAEMGDLQVDGGERATFVRFI